MPPADRSDLPLSEMDLHDRTQHAMAEFDPERNSPCPG
jgi:hypothetical protein